MDPKKRTPPRPRRLRPTVSASPELPKPNKMTIYATLARDETLSGRERCLACEGAFEDDDPILVLREHRLLVDYLLHCRCVTKIVSDGPTVVDFESYRDGLVIKYGSG